jgi:hypothetical protein
MRLLTIFLYPKIGSAYADKEYRLVANNKLKNY